MAFELLAMGSFNLVLYIVAFFRSRSLYPETFDQPIITRTAVVMPVYNEEMTRVAAGIKRTWLSAKSAAIEDAVDFYLLSDSVAPEAREAEDRAFQKLLPLFNAPDSGSGRLFLIRRENRSKYKAGNIANFLETHGHAYDFMVVLDADSVMTGKKIKRLICMMQQRPQTAIIQTLMFPIRSRTLFARAIQYNISRAVRLYIAGTKWFFGRDSIYWGHNAILRVKPFMEHCNLPIMPGEPPLGGDLMSHDIVEAALLGRAGWRVDWDDDTSGSFDEVPANIQTYGQRDRRWCQGNFQHFWLALGDGMRFGHRFHLAHGILGYLAGPFLLLTVVFGFVQGLRGRFNDNSGRTVPVFLCLMFLLIVLPKILSYLSMPKKQRRFDREALSCLIDLSVGFFMSWPLFYLHTQFVLGLLAGKMVPWVSQARDPEGGLEWKTATRMFWLPTILRLDVGWFSLHTEFHALSVTRSYRVGILHSGGSAHFQQCCWRLVRPPRTAQR